MHLWFWYPVRQLLFKQICNLLGVIYLPCAWQNVHSKIPSIYFWNKCSSITVPLLHPEIYDISNKMSVADICRLCERVLVLTNIDLSVFLTISPSNPIFVTHRGRQWWVQNFYPGKDEVKRRELGNFSWPNVFAASAPLRQVWYK